MNLILFKLLTPRLLNRVAKHRFEIPLGFKKDKQGKTYLNTKYVWQDIVLDVSEEITFPTGTTRTVPKFEHKVYPHDVAWDFVHIMVYNKYAALLPQKVWVWWKKVNTAVWWSDYERILIPDWLLHKWDYSQNFPWPGWWRTVRGRSHNIFQFKSVEGGAAI